jgi:3-oxoacyl-[acyl-carrier protein] reductase
LHALDEYLALIKLNTMELLQNKNAVIYGGGGSIGGAVAKALSAAGARIFLTGLHGASIEKTAAEITASGGKVDAAVVDARIQHDVVNHLEKVVAIAGHIDISFNAIGIQDVQNCLLIDMNLEDFVRPVSIAMETNFITATAAGRIMKQQGSGVILTLTATPGGIGYPHVGGFGPACAAIEALSINLASEIGPYGVRVVNMRSGGSIDSRVFQQAFADLGQEAATEIFKMMAADTMLKRMPVMKDIADAAVFLSSDWAQNITGTTLDLSCGTTSALNYKMKEGERSTPFD